MTTAVIRIAWNNVLWQYTHQQVACDGDGWFLLAGNLESHWAMNTKRNHAESRGQVIDLSPKIRIGKRKSALASVSFLGATPRWRAGRANSRRRGRPAVHRAPRRNGHRSLPRPGGARWRWRLHTGDSCRDA